MTEEYWRGKIWGLLHDPALKPLYHNKSLEGPWKELKCMEGWISPKDKSFSESPYSSNWLKHIGLCDLIASASDRATLGRLPSPISYTQEGLEIKHLLSGESQYLKLSQWHDQLLEDKSRDSFLQGVEKAIISDIKEWEDTKKVYWWLWRCYPQALATALGAEKEESNIHLLPAETRLPDGSLWSHTTMTSALAGALAGYHTDKSAYPRKRARENKDYYKSRPHIATFSFTPVQELIKASRKMRDFWAGSWLLHYLSAKVCWAIAWKYGPDTLLYPCLYEQPLIDLWLLKQYPDFKKWIKPPLERERSFSLLTAGFPNVLVMILPDNGASQTDKTIKNPVQNAMQQAEETLKQEWMKIGKLVLENLQEKKWMPHLNSHTWDGWLKKQWQTYWVAVPLGNKEIPLDHSPGKLPPKESKPDDKTTEKLKKYKQWEEKQNNFACPKKDLLTENEFQFVQATYDNGVREYLSDRQSKPSFYKRPNLNVGSWWPSLFDLMRYSLKAVKNARTWQLPTAFGPRSTLSGVGPVVHSGDDWVTEENTQKEWSNDMGLFDGIEELNATEVLKRGLHQILDKVLELDNQINRQEFYYPDLSSGVAGWLKNNPEMLSKYQAVCDHISQQFPWSNENTKQQPWGIPWIKNNHPNLSSPRLLNAGWLIEDFHPQTDQSTPLTIEQRKKQKQDELKKVRAEINKHFPPGSNPTDWYILAAGDGDSMGKWLKGEPLKKYNEYLPKALKDKISELPEKLKEPFQEFIQVTKRMGPASHSALSRALLDFSNQLVPYLTEERYAGRLIYGGGDDVLAYTNLWEWDDWLWDIRSCFQGKKDPQGEFKNDGDYWQYTGDRASLPSRPLFTMGKEATISFGVVIAHHSVPLAIALENLWEAEDEAKEHYYINGGKKPEKDAVQVRIIYGNGNILKATTKFDVFQTWRELLTVKPDIESSIFEQAANVWQEHPIPVEEAIAPWTKAFCSRREQLTNNQDNQFQNALANFLEQLWLHTPEDQLKLEVGNWLKLAAFTLRNRKIT